MTQKTVILTSGVVADLYNESEVNPAKCIVVQNTGGHPIELSEYPDMSGSIIINPGDVPYQNIVPGSAYARCKENGIVSVSFESFQPASQNGENRPLGLYSGDRAETVQFYIEANIKKGLQFYIRKSYPLTDSGRGLGPIPSGQSRYITLKTTTKTVLFKTRIVSYLGEEFSIELFKSPTVSVAGQQMTVRNYNGVNPQPTTVEIYKDATFTGGVPLDDEPEYYYGSTATGQRVGSSIPEGRERVLEKQTLFGIKITNTGSGDGRFTYFGDWFEGEPDLPRPIGE